MTEPAPENSPVEAYRHWRNRGQHSPPIWMQGVVALFAIGALTWVLLNLWPATVEQQAQTENPTQGAIVQARHHQLPVQIVRQRARMLAVMEPSQETRRSVRLTGPALLIPLAHHWPHNHLQPGLTSHGITDFKRSPAIPA